MARLRVHPRKRATYPEGTICIEMWDPRREVPEVLTSDTMPEEVSDVPSDAS